MEKEKKSGKTRKSHKYSFTLKNINTEKIDQKYGIVILSNITEFEKPENTTSITELTDKTKDISMELVSFLDETKKIYQCMVTMIDFLSNKEIIKAKGYKCFWCRHSFESIPIGCPINYISSKVIKKYHSEVSKDFYTIKENITKYKQKLLQNTDLFTAKNKSKITICKDAYFLTDGVFCSFNCVKAFIKDNKHNNLYERSDSLLVKLCNEMNMKDNESIIIMPAPHWRLLKEYGGTMTIDKFRENFNKCTYNYQGCINLSSLYKPVGMLYEEVISF